MRAAAVLCLLAAAAAAQAPDPAAAVPRLERLLLENILKFWYPQTLDRQHGGYRLNHDERGAWKGDAPKSLVTQARMVWFFARMARAGYGDRRQMLEAAEHGYRFLVERMLDPRHGGFYWRVDASGAQKLAPKKHLYGQAFALYALSEYAMASGRSDVLDQAVRLFELLEAKAHDRQHGGYLEYFNEDWSLPPEDETGYLGVPRGFKLMNTHLHLMEAMTAFWRASALPLARERLIELIHIEGSAVVRRPWGACSDRHRLDWTPVLEGPGGRASYGHDLENIWLLEDALRAAGLPVSPWLDFFRHNFDYSMRYGWDSRHGGFWDWGPLGRPAESRVKIWWVQAEALVSALAMYRLTGERQYWDVFGRTLQFVEQHMADWQQGDWHAQVDANLRPSGNKAHEWKAAYHNGRAMIECLQRLRGLR
ncbi:MAG: AGE family epimerase/isomerase [Bryobacteraceae bacterium]|nr:AGE family epimerase/isomerase [Bryobacteraceae bacterium]